MNVRTYTNIRALLLTLTMICSWHMMHSASTPIVYVGRDTASSVAVIDTSTNSVTTTVVLPANPSYNGVAMARDNSVVYVACVDNTIQRIQVSSNMLLSSIALTATPRSLAVSPDNQYVYATCSDNTVKRINVSTLMVDASISLPSFAVNDPRDIAITPNGSTAYVCNETSLASFVTPIRLSDNMVGSFVAITGTGSSPQPTGIAITPDSAYAYVATRSRTIQQLNLSVPLAPTVTNSIVSSNTGDLTRGGAITANGETAYFGNLAPRVLSVDIELPGTLAQGASLTVLDEPWMMVFNPNSNIAYMTDDSGNSVHVINITSPLAPTLITSIPVLGDPSGIAITFNLPTPTPSIPVPTDVIGKLKVNIFLDRTECILFLSWTASTASDIAFYNIYNGDVLIGTVSAGDPLSFCTLFTKCDNVKNFSVAAVDSYGAESEHVFATI